MLVVLSVLCGEVLKRVLIEFFFSFFLGLVEIDFHFLDQFTQFSSSPFREISQVFLLVLTDASDHDDAFVRENENVFDVHPK